MPSGFQFPFLDIDRAQNWKEFTAALARFPGSGAEFCLCRYRREHRVSCHRTIADPSSRTAAAIFRPMARRANANGRACIPFDDLPQFFNPARGRDRHGESESVSGGLQVSGERQFRGALSRRAEIRALLGAAGKMEAGGRCSLCRRMFIRLFAFSGEADRGGVRCAARIDESAAARSRRPACATGMGKWKKARRRRWSPTLLYQQLRKAAADRAAPGVGDDYDFEWRRRYRETAAGAPARMVPGLQCPADAIVGPGDRERREISGIQDFALGLRVS